MNPSQWGANLVSIGQGSVSIVTAGGSIHDYMLNKLEVSRTFPEYSVQWLDSRLLDGALVTVNAFCPISPTNSSCGFLPVTFINITTDCVSNEEFTVQYTLQVSQKGNVREDGYAAIGNAFLAVLGGSGVFSASGDIMTANVSMKCSSGNSTNMVFLLGYYDSNGYYADQLSSMDAMIAYAQNAMSVLAHDHQEFIRTLPTTGAPDMDEYIRWYLSAGILLTKGIKGGQVITMGYVEFNQRDSFWASWLHMVMWPDLDAQMLHETVQHQLPTGKIPTCILPLIERDDDIDITAYFIIRAVRHFDWHRNMGLARELWPALVKAAKYLLSLCANNTPQQRNFWADWKDVSQVYRGSESYH